MSKGKQKIITFFLIIFFSLMSSGCIFKPAATTKYALELEVWGLFDDRDAYDEIFSLYTSAVDTNVIKINYRKFTPDTYKKELTEALASGKGPDVFLIHNTWLPIFGDKIFPAPPQVLDEKRYRQNFVDVAINDFVYQNNVYAAPMTIDTLALYYNKNLFNKAGITAPPGDWNEFMEDSKKMTQIGGANQVIQSGAAMGTAYNINRATDVLSLLMLQAGTKMIDREKGVATFGDTVKTGNKNVALGENSLDFYTQFAKNSSSIYSWNAGMHYSTDAFSEGATAMMLNYSWTRKTIETKSPNLNFDIAPMPQLQGAQTINYANYWAFAVSNNKIANTSTSASKLPPVSNEVRITEAWKLISFLTTKPEGTLLDTAKKKGLVKIDYDPTVEYLKKTYNPAARRDLVNLQMNDAKIGIFAQQNLTAKSWYQADPEAIEAIFSNMIDEVNRGKATVREAISSAATRITRIMQSS